MQVILFALTKIATTTKVDSKAVYVQWHYTKIHYKDTIKCYYCKELLSSSLSLSFTLVLMLKYSIVLTLSLQ